MRTLAGIWAGIRQALHHIAEALGEEMTIGIRMAEKHLTRRMRWLLLPIGGLWAAISERLWVHGPERPMAQRHHRGNAPSIASNKTPRSRSSITSGGMR